MDVQLQIRQNATEMQEYVKDLFDWQMSIKKKERVMTASNASAAGSQSAAAPVPRGRASGAVAPAPAALMTPALGPKASISSTPGQASSISAKSAVPAQPKGKPAAVAAKRHAAEHTHSSYQKWDNFDVDAALASDDGEVPLAKTSQPPTKAPTQPAAAAAGRATSAASSGAAGSSGQGTATMPAASASPSSSAPASAPLLLPMSTLPPSAGISFRDPGLGDGQQGSAGGEELLRPVATTRLKAPEPPASSSSSSLAASGASTSATQQPASQASVSVPAAATAQPTALPPIRNSQPATPDAWRARGNDLFKAGEYDSAYECYSRSVELQPTCLGHANRAMALLKLGRWQEAVDDCSAALALDPTYVKAYQRRAVAHRHLAATAAAAVDWEAALRLEPENKATAADRDAALELLLAERKLTPPSRRVAVQVSWPASAAPAAPAAEPQPVQAPVPAAAVREEADVPTPQRAARVEEVEGAVQASAAGRSGESAGAGVRGISDVTAAAAGSVHLSAAERAAEPTTAGERPAVDAVVADVRPAPLAATASPQPAKTGPPSLAAAAPCTTAATATQAAAPPAPPAGVPSCPSSSRPALPPIPRTSVEFEAAWRGLAGQPGRQAAYLVAIPPAGLPTTFKNSLTAPVLAAMVRCLLAAMTAAASAPASSSAGVSDPRVMGQDADPWVAPCSGEALLEGLSKVSRFDLMAMSVPSRERGELKAAWEGLETALQQQQQLRQQGEDSSSGDVAAAEAEEARRRLAALRPKYRL